MQLPGSCAFAPASARHPQRHPLVERASPRTTSRRVPWHLNGFERHSPWSISMSSVSLLPCPRNSATCVSRGVGRRGNCAGTCSSTSGSWLTANDSPGSDDDQAVVLDLTPPEVRSGQRSRRRDRSAIGKQRKQVPERDGDTEPADKVASRRRSLKINVDLAVYKAKHLSKKGDYASQVQARKLLEYWIHKEPVDGRLYLTLSRMVERGDMDYARSLLDDGLAAVEGDNEHLWQAWASLEARAGNVGQARKYYDASLAANDKHAAAWHGWAVLELREGNSRRAMELLKKGIKRRPRAYLLQLELAQLFAKLGDATSARYHFARAAEVGYKSPGMWHARALFEADQGAHGNARKFFAQGVKVGRRNRYLFLSWALWEKEHGQGVSAARQLLRRGVKMNPNDAPLWQAWAMLEAEQGDACKARELFANAVRADATHQPAYTAWGVFESRQGNTAKARELWQQGVWTDPMSPSTAYSFQAWAVQETKEGRLDVARELFKCAIKADPRSVPSWEAWINMERDNGFYTRADELQRYYNEVRSEMNYELSENAVTLLGPSNLGRLSGEDTLVEDARKLINRWFAFVGSQ